MLIRKLQRLFVAPGIILHEVAHKEVAEDIGLTVHEVCHFQVNDNPPGFVTHDKPRTYGEMLAVSGAPFLFNSLVAFTLFTGCSYFLIKNGYPVSEESMVKYGLIAWIGVAAGLRAFPSDTDIGNIWLATKESMPCVAAILGLPIVSLLYALDRTRRVKSHYLYTGLFAYLSYRFAVFIVAAG